MLIQFQTRQGRYITREFVTREAALERLAFLNTQEAETRRVAPTDSGDVRFNYTAERRAIERHPAYRGFVKFEKVAP